MSRELKFSELATAELPRWDEFVRASPQGALFSESLWLQAIGLPYRIFLCWKGTELVGGVAVFVDSSDRRVIKPAPYTPYQGILFRDNSAMRATSRESLQRDIALALVAGLEGKFDRIYLPHHWTFEDLRPYYWHSYGRKRQYKAVVNYTYVASLASLEAAWDAMDESTRWEVRKGQKNGIKVSASIDFETFDQLHVRTFQRQGIDRGEDPGLPARIYAVLSAASRCRLYMATDTQGRTTSGALIVSDSKRAYYLFGASEPEFRNNGSASLVLWEAISGASRQHPEFDFVGCNSPKRGAFKQGFGGRLKNYYVVSLED